MPNFKQERGFVHFLPVLAVGLFSFLLIASFIPVSRHYNDGKSNVAGVYLAEGGDDKKSDDKKSSDDSNRGSSNVSVSQESTSTTTGGSPQTSTSGSGGSSSVQATPKPVKVETKEVKNKVENKEVEIKEVSQNSQVETKTTPEKIKSEIRQGNVRVKFEIENGEVKVKTEVKASGKETELENEAENEAVKEVEAELEKADIKIATAPGQVALVNKGVGALSSFPLSVNPATRELIVTTPGGSKVVTVLPQKAVDNMLAAKVLDDILGEKVNNTLASIPDLVKLEMKDGVLVYDIKGTKTHKLLGFIPIKTAVEAFISAENGQVTETNQSLLGRILNRIAP